MAESQLKIINNGGEMTSKVYVDKEGIVNIESIGPQSGEEMLRVRSKLLEIAEERQEKIKILDDLSRVTKTTPESRRTAGESTKLDEISKVACFGGGTVMRVMTNFIVKISGMEKKVKYFDTKEEAVKWLKERL